MCVQLLQQFALKLLTGHHLAHGGFRHDYYLPYMLYGVELALRHRCNTQAASQYGSPLSTVHFLIQSPSLPNPRGLLSAFSSSSAGLLTYRLVANVFPKKFSDLICLPLKGRLTAAGKAAHRRLPAGFCPGFSPDSLLIAKRRTDYLGAKIRCFCETSK